MNVPIVAAVLGLGFIAWTQTPYFQCLFTKNCSDSSVSTIPKKVRDPQFVEDSHNPVADQHVDGRPSSHGGDMASTGTEQEPVTTGSIEQDHGAGVMYITATDRPTVLPQGGISNGVSEEPIGGEETVPITPVNTNYGTTANARQWDDAWCEGFSQEQCNELSEAYLADLSNGADWAP